MPQRPKRLTRTLPPIAFALLVAAALVQPASADYIVGGTGNDNVFPFGTTTYYTGEYQQLYSAGAFPGPLTINEVSFQSIKLLVPGSETLNVTLGLSTTTASLSSPSQDYAANKGADFTTVFSGPVTFTGQNNGTFDLVFPVSPFTYNPAAGNLLLDVVINSSGGNGIASFTSGPSNDVSRVYNIGGIPGATTLGVHEGLLTRFTPAAAVPEPGLLGRFGVVGVVALAGLGRRALRR